MWTLYLLYHKEANRTYIGVTTNLKRRLRQHNGEIVGGAKFTERTRMRFDSSLWSLVLAIDGFCNQSEVTRWERLLKMRTRGLKQREQAFHSLLVKQCPPSFTEKQKTKYVVPDYLLKAIPL